MEPALIKAYLNLTCQNVRGFSQRTNDQKEKKYIYSHTSRLENPEELQLNHNHEKLLFSTVLLLFAQFKINNW
jgi:hypothetical protein